VLAAGALTFGRIGIAIEQTATRPNAGAARAVRGEVRPPLPPMFVANSFREQTTTTGENRPTFPHPRAKIERSTSAATSRLLAKLFGRQQLSFTAHPTNFGRPHPQKFFMGARRIISWKLGHHLC
jgi:hypothetical protein